MMRFPLHLALLLLATISPLIANAAHPFHVCIAQMEWNGESQLWEVSVRLHPQDLERVLSQARGKPVSIEDPDFSEQAIPFLNKQFAIVHAPNSIAVRDLLASLDRDEDSRDETPFAKSELRWIGMESERGWLWIHLEMPPPSKNKTLDSSNQTSWLIHRIFLEQIDRQENSVRIIHGPNRSSMQFRKGHEAQAMKQHPAETKNSESLKPPGDGSSQEENR